MYILNLGNIILILENISEPMIYYLKSIWLPYEIKARSFDKYRFIFLKKINNLIIQLFLLENRLYYNFTTSIVQTDKKNEMKYMGGESGKRTRS